NPKDGRARRRLAELLAKAEQWADAEKVLQDGMQVDENASDLRDRLGDLKLASIDREIRKLDERLGSEDKPGLREDLELLRKDRRDLEVKEWRRRVQERPTDLALWFHLGRVLQEMGEVDEALAAFQRAVKDPKTRVDALVRLGGCFQKKVLLDL